MDFIDACRAFISIDSSPSAGTLELAELAAKLCVEAGLNVELQKETHNGLDQANVIARPSENRPEAEFLLQAHLDTTDPGNFSLWQKTGANPFSASLYMDSIYGLGAAHVKLDFLCKLSAIASFKNAKWRLPPVLVGTFGEELGMPGAIKLIRRKKISARMALVGEPTQMSLIHAGKGFAAVEIEVPFSQEEREFRARHDMGESTTTQSKIFLGQTASAAPERDESAILKLLDYLAMLPNGIAVMEVEGGVTFNTLPTHAVLEIVMAGELKDTIGQKIKHLLGAISLLENDFKGYPDPSFSPEYPTLNIGMIRTHENHLKFSGCSRFPPSVSNDVYERWMSDLKNACEVVGASFRVNEYKQPFRTTLNSNLVKICREQAAKQGFDTTCRTQSVTNEANVFSRFGIECVVTGPGQGVGNSHTPEEHVKISQLHEATAFYQGVIERICL